MASTVLDAVLDRMRAASPEDHPFDTEASRTVYPDPATRAQLGETVIPVMHAIADFVEAVRTIADAEEAAGALAAISAAVSRATALDTISTELSPAHD